VGPRGFWTPWTTKICALAGNLIFILVTILIVFRRNKEMRNTHTVLIRKPEERNDLEDLSTNGTIILKWNVY
jgi:hypothetical protein